MIQYIYFVKRPNCDEEPFDFFDEAKEFAISRLSDKPVITQTEVCRNDFGECTDSCDLGTIWSWEDMMSDMGTKTDDESIFCKGKTLCYADDYDTETDPEFAALDNSLDFVPDNFRKPVKLGEGISDATRAPKDSDFVIVSKPNHGNTYSFLGSNYRMTRQLDKAMPYTSRADAEYDIRYAEDQSANYDQYFSDQFFVTTYSEAKTLVKDLSNQVQQRAEKAAERRALADEIRQLAIDMYNDNTQCNTWEEFEAFMLANGYPQPTKYLYYNTYRAELERLRRPKRQTNRLAIPEGMTIEQLKEEMEENEDTVECTWCEELFDKSECRKEVDLGWLCSQCEAAIKSRGESLTFVENESFARDPFDHHDPEYSEEEAADYTADLIDRAKEARFDAAVDTLAEAAPCPPRVPLEYDDLKVTKQYNFKNVNASPGSAAWFDPIEWDEWEGTTEYTYEAYTDEIVAYIAENLLTEEDVAEVPGGLASFKNDDALYDFIEANLDKLVAKYEKEILAEFRSSAEEDCQDEINHGNFTPTSFSDEDDAYWDWVDSEIDSRRDRELFDD